MTLSCVWRGVGNRNVADPNAGLLTEDNCRSNKKTVFDNKKMYTAFKCKQRVAKKLKAVKVTIGKSMAL